MKRKFLTNLTLLIFLNLLVKPFWVLGIDLTVQNRTGAEEYGFYFSLLSFSLLLNIVQDMGIANFNSRNIARNHDLVERSLPNILILKILLGSLYFSASLLIALIIGYESSQIKLLAVLLFNQVLNSINLYLRSNITGLQQFRTDSILSITDRLLMILICSVLLWGNIVTAAFRIEWFVYAQTTAYFLTTIISFLTLRKNAPLTRIKFDPALTIKILIKSYPYAILGLFMVLYYRIDTVMLERMIPCGRYQAGIYAQSFRLLDAASMLGFLFAGILMPMFAKMIKKGEPVKQLFRFSFMLLLLPAVTTAISTGTYRHEIMNFLYLEQANESANIFGILMISFVFMSCSIIAGTYLTAAGKISFLNKTAFAGVIINITMNIILIPAFQATGAAIASLLTQIIIAHIQILKVAGLLKFSPGWQRVMTFLLYLLLLVISGFFIRSAEINWIWGLLLMTIFGAGIAFALKLLTLNEIREALF